MIQNSYFILTEAIRDFSAEGIVASVLDDARLVSLHLRVKR